jgi:hypothetical protein
MVRKLIPTLDQFTDQELSNPDKGTLSKIKRFKNTLSYAILTELHARFAKGDQIVMNTIRHEEAQADWLKFARISYIIHQQDTQTKKDIDEAQEEIERNRLYIDVRYYIDEETGKPVIVSQTGDMKIPLNNSTRAMFG